jgi:hypothetical protein
LIQAMPNYTWGSLVAVCVGLGCRKSEAFRLRPEDVEVRTTTSKDAQGNDAPFERMFIWIDGRKTEGSNRIVPVLSGMRPLLEYALPHLPIGELGNVARTFSLACKRAQIERCSPNDLRRTHATLIGKRGVKNEFIAGLLGHSSTAMAERVYNQAKADELAPVVEELLSRAAPIEFGSLSPEATKVKATPGRKRGGGGATGGGSVDLGELGGPFDGSDLDGDGSSSAPPAVGYSCTPDATFSRQCSETMSFRGAPRKIRTCDLWLRRPGNAQGNTAAASNPAETVATDSTLTHVIASTRNDVFATFLPVGSAVADQDLEVESTGFLSPFRSTEAEGRSPDLTVPTHPAQTEIEASIPDCDWYGGKFIVPTPSDLEAINAESAARIRKANEAAEAVIGDPRIIGGGGRYEGSHGASRRREPLRSVPSELVRIRSNGLREYSTPAGSVWGWS